MISVQTTGPVTNHSSEQSVNNL